VDFLNYFNLGAEGLNIHNIHSSEQNECAEQQKKILELSKPKMIIACKSYGTLTRSCSRKQKYTNMLSITNTGTSCHALSHPHIAKCVSPTNTIKIKKIKKN